MNEQQRYEKHLAEKFQQLPVPDVETNWQQMKLLLDKEMPRGGGYWRWITGVGILLLMLGGTWLFISRQDSDTVARTGTGIQVDVPGKETPSDPGLVRSSDKTVQSKDKGISDDERSSQKNDSQLSNETKTEDIEKTLPNTSQNINSTTGSNDKLLSGKRNANPETTSRQKSNRNRRAGNSIDPRSAVPAERIPDKKFPGATTAPSDRSPYLPNEVSLKSSSPRYQLRNTISEFEINKLAGETIKQDYSTLLADKNAENLKAQKGSSKTKTAKSKALAAVENRTLAIGLSLPMGFPLGDQKPGAYNINAKPNTVSDFLPVPHLQYHLNSKLYLQTEVQLMNPQFIQPVLLYENKTDFPSTNTVHYNSVYAKKLYYFNLPVGIHYSPFEHFYLGTGLQFSSLVSGVAMHEETSFVIGTGNRNLLSQTFTRFKNDSISSRIDNSEFRLMLDANYYWKQFTVGLRYNQALSNYVSFRLNNVTPLFQDKNKSLQFYLRYNLWEKYKRR